MEFAITITSHCTTVADRAIASADVVVTPTFASVLDSCVFKVQSRAGIET